ncbi:MarR family transcriptional regulator [Galbitalea sp. SE-J8]|uniref:MarR family winged helix-turn-helix transcriptional regulator n=1 Tax=Galbitalea sp. SE-J8 TaxID=3054952 RepID=UPI00259CB535|nr:MarR family transcriptional regulator [Galbitalea sp. SE-J8]MDM4763786.1 MarR family transcriptional regulator [Galbitalea sp. SE-J8]
MRSVSPSAPLPPLESRASFLVSQLGIQSAQRFAAGLAPLGLNPNQFGLLVHVARAEGQSQQQLADTLGLHRNTMVALIDDLEARGLAERRRHPRDRRAYAIHLTSEARRLLPEASRIADEQEALLVEDLSRAERTQLIGLLARISARTGQRAGVHPGYAGPGEP